MTGSDSDAFQSAYTRDGFEMNTRLHARANDGEIAGFFTREYARRQRANCRSANRRNRRSINHREHLAGHTIEQNHTALMRILADFGIAGKNTNRFQSE